MNAQRNPEELALSESELDAVAGGQTFTFRQSGGPTVYYPDPRPRPYPYPYTYTGPFVVSDPNQSSGPVLLNGKWTF